MKFFAKIFMIVLVGMSFFSCKKEEKKVIPVTQIVLSDLIISGDSIRLNWTVEGIDSILSFKVNTTTDTTKAYTLAKQIHVDRTKTQYSDTMVLMPYTQYYVTANLISGRSISSNKQTFYHPTEFMNIYPTDVIFDRIARQLYIYSTTGEIILYDLQSNRSIKTVKLNTSIGYCDVGLYNGVKELYIPGTDGRLYIYNANTFDKIDEITVSESLSCVVYSNGILFLCCDTGMGNNVVSYDRATKIRLSHSSDMPNSSRRIKLIPSTNYDFFGIIGYWISSHKFNNAGVFLSQNYLFYGTNVRANIFEIFPDGSKFINNSYGEIFDKNLIRIAALQRGNSVFTSFDFDKSDQLIYAGCATKNIEVYAMSDYTLKKTISTSGYPIKVFYDKGALFSVSRTTDPFGYSTYPSYLVIEQL